MAKYEFRLPDIGEGVTEGEIVTWLVKPGDQVVEDQEMVEVMTDKATVTIGSPKAGTIVACTGKVGDVVPVGGVLVVYEVVGGVGTSAGAPAVSASAVPAPVADSSRQEPAATAVGDIKETLPGMAAMAASRSASPGPVAVAPGAAYHKEKPVAAPATRKLARELGIDLRKVPPTGPAERVTQEDLERFRLDAAASTRTPLPSGSPSPGVPLAVAGPASPPAAVPVILAPPASEGDERVPVRGLRKRIFENMARSKHTAAHFTYVDECDATALKALRERTKPLAAKAGVKLSYLPFIVKASVAALKLHPALNCVVDENGPAMVLKRSFHVGIAAASEAGLTVPVVRNVERLSILELAREIERLGEDARIGKLKAADLGGSSFTITSLGKAGGLFATPIVNYPEVAILGVHEMKRRPVVRGNDIVIGDVMLLSLSFDHRVIDGHVGAAFAQEIIRLLENPDSLLLEMS